MFNIRDFGAVGNGIQDDTAAIQSAIEACRAKGGGQVVVPQGTYLCSPFVLYSYINLHLESGSVLLATTDLSKYPDNIENQRAGMIRAIDAKSISITGVGTIDLQGMKFMDASRARIGDAGVLDYDEMRTRQKETFRKMDDGVEDGPALDLERPGNHMQFHRCENITMRDIVILDSPQWTVQCTGCQDIVISGVTIKSNLLIPNSDGIHLQNCQRVRISDCHIECGDDAFAFTGYGPEGSFTEDVVVTNCTLISRSSAIRMGYGKSNMRNMLFNNIIIKNSNRGIAVFQRDAGIMENIIFSNFVIETRLHTGHWWGQGEPISITSTIHNSAEGFGKIKNVLFSNIFAKAESGMLLYGCPESIIEDVVFDNVRFEITPSKLAERYGGNIDLRPVKDITFGLFEHKECGLYAEKVNGLRVHNFNLHWNGNPPSYFEHGLEFNDCENVVVDGYTGKAPHQSEKSRSICVERCNKVTVRNSDDASELLTSN
ncbi:glycoside hydrolase family 28 protein [Paenibacillus montanisoli]|uniref:Rhamnogalacturonase A/B/Epimerase-like pectate lyase domain-containing protein n=1 Tax=Paenibacillus montanisoli TaxID=2081970 RepID=A0A328UEN6_9BACL|nr:glycosyl hydrolase family 28 protein [Paenibacillus montanisoli]RAP78416.1 hypothetical protein DL346_08325 [Paenibacillus montanisoli]